MHPKCVNEAKTSVGSVTEGLPKRMPSYPFEIIHGPQQPARPDPTYTFWNHPNDTFPMGSVVYFVYCAGRIKIGYSDGLRTRLKLLTRSSPFPPVVVLVMKGGMPAEQKLHVRFAVDRLHGEWFRLSKKMRSFLRSKLCPVGRASLKKAEEEFVAACAVSAT